MSMPPALQMRAINAWSIVAEVFAREHEVPPVYFAETAAGEAAVVPRPDFVGKEAAVKLVRELFAEWKVVRYASITEAWIVRGDNLAVAIRPSQHAAKIEIILVTVEGPEGFLMSQRPILRPSNKPPYLGPLEWLDAREVGGRFVGLLAAANTLH